MCACGNFCHQASKQGVQPDAWTVFCLQLLCVLFFAPWVTLPTILDGQPFTRCQELSGVVHAICMLSRGRHTRFSDIPRNLPGLSFFFPPSTFHRRRFEHREPIRIGHWNKHTYQKCNASTLRSRLAPLPTMWTVRCPSWPKWVARASPQMTTAFAPC